MKPATALAIVAALLVLGAVVIIEVTASDGAGQPMPLAQRGGGWHGMMGAWRMGRGWGGPGPIPRHQVAMMDGIPAPYASMSNPLPRTDATLRKGTAVYAAKCVACHGEQGLGNGPAGRNLSPPPGNLAWLADMPMAQWDSLMYWTIAEGGSQFGTAMPAFKGALSKDQIWAVAAYVQARLPKGTH
jgi:mono/diheme cytochrome c family protein